MKVLFLSAALAATVSTGANAVVVQSNITDVALWFGQTHVAGSTMNSKGKRTGAQAAGSWSVSIGGDTELGLTLDATFEFYTQSLDHKIVYSLGDGDRLGTNGENGTKFTSGSITAFTKEVAASDYIVADYLDASSSALNFLYDGWSTQGTSGLVVDDNGFGTLGGISSFVSWTVFGPQFYAVDDKFNQRYINGVSHTLLLEGDISASPVPVPAAAWLFSSALIGLGGLIRKKGVNSSYYNP